MTHAGCTFFISVHTNVSLDFIRPFQFCFCIKRLLCHTGGLFLSFFFTFLVSGMTMPKTWMLWADSGRFEVRFHLFAP